MKVVQVMNALDPTDAVSLHLLELDRTLRELGHETEIYAEHAHRSLRHVHRSMQDLPRSDGDLLLFHFAGYSRLLGPVAGFRGRKGVVYHNVTPPELFAGYPEAHAFCLEGRKQIPALAELFDFGLADSSFNARELAGAGMGAVRVLPIPWETSRLDETIPDPGTLQRLAGGGPAILLVGRVAPSKGILHAIRAVPALVRRFGPSTRLDIVGRTRGYDRHVREITREVARLKVDAHVHLAGEVTREALRAHYARADVLLVVSDHEGFCVPIVEAMGLDVPVVAFPAGAVRETLGDGGVFLEDRTPDSIVHGVESAAGDDGSRERTLRRQRVRREHFSRATNLERLRDALAWASALPLRRGGPWPPRISVVVCTYNRDWVLENCLASLRSQEYPSFEVVVVNGPSTDRTAEVIARFPEVKAAENPERNLSVSRNLGIRESAGELVAFLDDDAVAESDWLATLAEAFRDPAVGAAGGTVFGPDGEHLQFRNGTITRFGMPIAIHDEPGRNDSPEGGEYDIAMGTNACFRRTALDAVGGYDENYEYYHDESDLCVRLIQAGYRVAHVPDAVVWHGAERGPVRKSSRDMNWLVVEKNTIYFYFRVNRWKRRPWDVLQPMRACLVHLGSFTRWFVRGEMGLGVFARSLARWTAGVFLGYAKGFFVPPKHDLAKRVEGYAPSFRPFGRRAVRGGRAPRHAILVSQQYPPDACGGIGVYTEILARGLVEAGHRATVVAWGRRAGTTWRDGVRVVRVPHERVPRGIPAGDRITRKNVARSLSVHRAIREIARRQRVDVVESALWDAEGFAACLAREFPHVLRLTTPMAVVAEAMGWPRGEDLRLACEMEWELVREADCVVDSSGTIAETLASRYGVRPVRGPLREIPFGIPIPPPDSAAAAAAATRARDLSDVRILFVGRLEPRKGFDVFVEAMEELVRTDPAAKFWVAGEGSPDDPAVRRARSLAAAHPGRVELFGWVDDATRSHLYAECDVFAAPSRYESFGLVYLEAMAWGKPCIACDVGGARKVVPHRKVGLTVSPGDAATLAEAMRELVRDRGLRVLLGAAAREHVALHYSVGAMVERTLDLYDELLAGAAGAPQPAAAVFSR